MKLLKPFKRLAKAALVTLPGQLVRQSNKENREARREGRAQMGAMNEERQAIQAERATRESELTSKRNRLALGMARARRNRGGLGFGSSAQPQVGNVKSTLG